MKYTPWFDPVTQPPVHHGWYPVKWKKAKIFWQRQFNRPRMHWNGVTWSDVVIRGDNDTTVLIALKYRDPIYKCEYPDFQWRGLTEPHPDYKEGK